jgi:DNA polymerase-3 subunit delta'
MSVTIKQLGIYGHDQALQIFLDAWNNQSLHHGWLLSGPKGVGKSTAAFKLAELILSDGKMDEGTRAKLKVGSHPDLFILREEMGIESVRAMIDFMRKTPMMAGYRVGIIDGVDRMGVGAANALLKILEEPLPKTVLLLVCHSLANVLSTIRSRTALLKISPLSIEAFSEVLRKMLNQEIEADRLSRLYTLSNGVPALAYEIEQKNMGEIDLEIAEVMPNTATANRFERLTKLAETAASSNESWQIVINALFIYMQNDIKREGKNGPSSALLSKLDFLSNTQRLVREAEILNLDKSQVLISILA